MKRCIAFTLLLLLLSSLMALPAAGAEPDYQNSTVFLLVDTALADGSDAAELEVSLLASDYEIVKNRSVYAASSREGDRISVGANEDGLIIIEVSSREPGISRIAVSLASRDAATQYLKGTMGTYDAKIIPTSTGKDYFTVYFIAGNLDIDYCMMEFDKDAISITNAEYSDNAIGTVYLRTETDNPVANQQVTIHANKAGLYFYPALSSPNQVTGSNTVITTDDEGKASFVVRGSVLGDFEIFATVDGQEFSEFLFVDLPENVFDLEVPDLWEDEDEEEEERYEISRAHTLVSRSKIRGDAYGRNPYFGLSSTEEDWDKILIGGVAKSAEGEPIREEHLVSAYVTAGALDKSTTLTTSTGGAFSFSIVSKDPCLGRYAVGLGTPEQLRGYLEGTVSADACGLLGSDIFLFGEANWHQYLFCTIGSPKAVSNDKIITLDAVPFILNGRTMITARPLADAIEGKTAWNGTTRTATFTVGSKNIAMTAGSRIIHQTEQYVLPKEYESDVAATLRDGRIFLPMRALAQIFGMEVLYDSEQQMVCIYNTAIKYREYDPYSDPNSPLYDPN